MSMDRRKYAREWRRALYDRKLAEQNATRRTCARRFGKHGLCGARLETGTDGGGRVTLTCPRCARFVAGLCALCPRPVSGTIRRARFCVEHRKTTHRSYVEDYRQEHADELRRKAKNFARKNRERRADYKRAWRKANRERVRAQKRRSALRQLPRVREYMQAYRTQHPEKMARSTTPRVCLTCSNVVRGRVKKCSICKAREALIAREHPSIGRGRGWRKAA